MTLLSKFGNFPVTCPIVKGNYFLKDFHMDPDSIMFSMFQFKNEELNHLLRIVLLDENSKKPVKIYKYEFYMSIKKKKKINK
jgi:hypothetical protein